MKIPKVGGYFIANAVQAGLQFVMVPLLTRSLGVVQYGKWGLFEPVIAILALIMQFGINWGVVKLVNQDGVTASNALRAIAIKGWWFPIALLPVISLGSWCLLGSSKIAFGLPLVVFSEAALGLVLACARAENRSGVYGAGVSIKFFGLTSIASSSAYMHFPKVTSATELLFWWAGCVAIAVVVAGIFLFRPSTKKSNEKVDVAAAVKYGVPLLLAALLGAILNSADRYVVEMYATPESLAAYIVALKVSGAMNFILTPVALWWPTARFEHLRDSDGGQRFFVNTAEKMSLIYGTASASLWLISALLVHLFSPHVSYSSIMLAGLCLAVAFRGMEAPLNIGLLKEGKTHWSIVMVGFGAIVHLSLCFFAIPKWGVVGAACATTVSSLIGTSLVHWMSQRIQFARFRYMRIFFLVFAPWLAALSCTLIGINVLISVSLVLSAALFLGAILRVYPLAQACSVVYRKFKYFGSR